MKKILVYCVALLVAFLAFTGNADATIFKKDTYIVQYDSQHSKVKVEQAVAEVIYELDSLSMLVVAMDEEELEELQKQGDIKHFEKNQSYKINSEFKIANLSSAEADRWNLKELQVSSAWQDGYTGKGIKIAIIDSGIANHSDLTIAGGVSFVGQSYEDDHGHGTHVAGIIGAKHNGIGVAGVAPDTQIYAVKSIKSDGFGDVVDVLKGIDWSIENNMDIINLSFGDLESSDALYEGIVKAKNRGILIVGASGNEGTANGAGNTLNYPARHEEVISVGAIDRHFARASFSGTGPTNDFAAPGVEIYSTYLNGQYATYSGTSMATPHVAGLLALLKEQYPYLSAEQLREGLQYMVQDLGTPGFDEWYGHGLPKYKQADEQKIAQLLAENHNATQLKAQIDSLPKGLEKLALLNNFNESQQVVIKQLDEAFAAFSKKPSAAHYEQIEKQIAELASSALQKEKQQQLEAIILDYMASAEKAVKAFEKNKSVMNYRKADTELEKIIALPQKQQLMQQLEAQLYEFAKTAISSLDNYKKKPTQDNYAYAKLTINNLPASSIREELMTSLQVVVQTANKKAATDVVAYEKQKTLKHYEVALKATKAVHDEQLRAKLEQRLQKVVASVSKKAKLRVENYEKKKTKANRELALKLVRELPESKGKAEFLKRLK